MLNMSNIIIFKQVDIGVKLRKKNDWLYKLVKINYNLVRKYCY
jgi:hypothetical protein